MAAPIATRLVLNTKMFQKGLSKATKGVGMLGGALGKVGGIIAKFGLALTAATAGVAAIVLRSAQYIDRLGKVSTVTGVATDTLQKFGFAAEQAGVTSDNAALALRRFSRRLGEAQKNTGELLPALRRLGIDTKDSEGNFKSAEQVLFEFADGIAGVDDASQKLALAFKAFDSEGAELVGTLNQGSAGLKEMFEEAQALGIVLDSKTIKGVEKFNDSLNKLQRMIGGLINRLVGELAPALDEFVNNMIDLIKETAEAEGGFENLGKVLKDKFLSIAQAVARAFFEIYRALVLIINGAIRLLEKAGLINEVSEIQRSIDELRESSKAGILDKGFFMITVGKFKELRDEFGLLEILSDEDYEKAIAILEKVKTKVESEGGGQIEMLDMPTEEDFASIFNFLEKYKETAKEVATEIEEVVVTGTKTQMGFFEKMLDKVFGKAKMDDFFSETEKFAEKAVLNIGDFITITFSMMAKSVGEFFENIKEKLAASGIGDFAKTLEDGFIKAGQLLEDALTDAVLTGKASFSDLADHIKKVLAKALIQKFITGPILGLMGLADGGPAKAGTPYVVGEEGPELFVPNQSGTVIPNDEMASGGSGMGMGTQVTYNINAIDSRSFEARLAENPEYLFNVTQVGARRQPA